MLGKLSILAVVGAAVIGFIWPVTRGGTSQLDRDFDGKS